MNNHQCHPFGFNFVEKYGVRHEAFHGHLGGMRPFNMTHSFVPLTKKATPFWGGCFFFAALLVAQISIKGGGKDHISARFNLCWIQQHMKSGSDWHR